MNALRLEQFAGEVLSAAIAGGDWIGRLDAVMGEMKALGGGPARPVPPDLFAIPTRGLREAFGAFRIESPPVTKADVIPLLPGEAFVADYMRSSYAAKRRTVLCNEFQRPRGICHESAALLDHTPAGPVRLLVFRDDRQGRFEADELEAFSRTLPYLRSAAMLARSSLQAMARLKAEPFERRGEPVLYLDVGGRLLEANPAAESALGAHVQVIGRRLVTAWSQDQVRLDRALSKALAQATPGLVTLQGAEHRRPVMALVLPVSGDAKDVFYSTAALIVLIDPARSDNTVEGATALLAKTSDLTAREIDVVRLVGAGRSPKDAADDLGIGYGTVRNHLKGAFSKLGLHRQGELIALIRRLG